MTRTVVYTQLQNIFDKAMFLFHINIKSVIKHPVYFSLKAHLKAPTSLQEMHTTKELQLLENDQRSFPYRIPHWGLLCPRSLGFGTGRLNNVYAFFCVSRKCPKLNCVLHMLNKTVLEQLTIQHCFLLFFCIIPIL